MKKFRWLLYPIVFTLFTGCRENKAFPTARLLTQPDSLTLHKAYFQKTIASAKDLTPIEFLQILLDTSQLFLNASGNLDPFPFVTMQHDFPKNWINETNINDLIPLIYSQQQCKCYVNPISSFLPLDSTANIGGFAIAMVNAYKEKEPVNFGLYTCPKFDKIEADLLKVWWEKNNGD